MSKSEVFATDAGGAFDSVYREYARHEKANPGTTGAFEWLAALGRAFGDLSEAMLLNKIGGAAFARIGGRQHMRKAAVKLAALIVGMIEENDRNEETERLQAHMKENAHAG